MKRRQTGLLEHGARGTADAALGAPDHPRAAPARATSRRVTWGRETLLEAVALAFSPTRRNVLHWLSWAIALGAELAFVVMLQSGHVYGWEQTLVRRLQDVPGRQVVFDVTSTLTNTLSLSFALIFLSIAAVVWLSGHRGAAIVLALSFPLHVLAQFPKALIDRPRPSPLFDGIEGVGGFQSFPSGHSEYVVTFYGFLAYLLMLHIHGRWSRAAIAGVWFAFVLATGFGRVALGRHWPLDVLASYVIGLGLLSGMLWLYAAFRSVRNRRIPG